MGIMVMSGHSACAMDVIASKPEIIPKVYPPGPIKMCVVVNTDLEMSVGKIGEQIGRAVFIGAVAILQLVRTQDFGVDLRDVLVVQWHWDTQANGDCFVTCGRRHGRMPTDFFCNPGTCYRREALSRVIPHICDEYFKDNRGYLKKHFPTMDGMDGVLDDGLIRKVGRSINGRVVVADPAVCVHSGFHYYNNLSEYTIKGGTIQERIQQLRELLPTVDPKGRYTQDFEPF